MRCPPQAAAAIMVDSSSETAVIGGTTALNTACRTIDNGSDSERMASLYHWVIIDPRRGHPCGLAL